MNSKSLSTNFSSQALSLWKDPIHLHRGLKIIQDMLTDKQYYDLWKQFFTNTPLTAVTAEHYAVGMIRFQKPKLYKILVQIIAEFKKWKPLSPINADFVLFETNENKLVLERSRLLEKADFLVNDPEPIERWIRMSLRGGTFQNYEKAAKYTMERRDELPEEDKLHKALVDALRAKLEGNVAIFEERKAARCAICLDEMQEMKVLKCGHMFCKNGIETWMEQEKTCPTCRAKVSHDDLKEKNQREFRKSMWQKQEQAKKLKY
jgi:hypothetical protein